MFIPAKHSFRKAPQEWMKLILNEFESVNNQLTSVNQAVTKFY